MHVRTWFLTVALLISPAVVAQTTAPADPTYEAARQAYRAGDYTKAVTLTTKAVDANPKNAKAFLLRAAARFKAKDFEGAIGDYNKIIELEPNSTRAYGGRGIVLAEKGDLSKAEADFTKVIEIDKENKEANPAAFFQRARARARLGKVDESIADWNAVVILDPDNGSAYLDRALLLFYKNKFSQALEDWQKVTTLNSKSAEGFAGQAIALSKMGQKEEALTSLKAAVILEPRFSKDYDWVGGFSNNGPDWNFEAINTLKELNNAQP